MPKYTKQQIDFIVKNYLTMTYSEIGKEIGKSYSCVSEWIKRNSENLGLVSKISEMRKKKPSHTYRAFSSWASMKTRCENPNRESWDRYGGRGIKVCERWSSFQNFLSDMGERPAGYSIDRIDPNGDYCPENCRWIPMENQSKTTERFLNITMCCDCGTRRGNRKGRCHRCSEYFRRTGNPRPKCESSVPMRPRPVKICTNCNRPSRPTTNGKCRACDAYFQRTGKERPESLWRNTIALFPSKRSESCHNWIHNNPSGARALGLLE